MELRHLKYFVAVAENLNFTKAAAKLHLAQPSLTRLIHNLEEETGVRLLNRSKSQVALTEEGRSFLVDARRVLALATESVQTVQRLSRGATGPVLLLLVGVSRLQHGREAGGFGFPAFSGAGLFEAPMQADLQHGLFAVQSLLEPAEGLFHRFSFF